MIAETYIQGSGLLYKLDPRPKLFVLLVITFVALIEDSLLFQFFLYLFLFFIGIQSMGLKLSISPIKSILPIIILTAVLTPLFYHEGRVILSIGKYVFFTDLGMTIATLLILRFSIITTTFFLFFSTTITAEFILALRAFGLPFRAAITVTISLRYIPDMFHTYNRIIDAHKLRNAGLSFEKRKNLGEKIRKIFPVLISVLIHAVKGIPSLAMALDSKGFDRKNKRTFYNKLKPWKNIVDHIVISLIFVILIICLSVVF